MGGRLSRARPIQCWRAAWCPVGSEFEMTSGAPLIDTFGRVHNKLRISVTDRCDIRCYYCMPETGRTFAPREGLLSVAEIERIVRVAVPLGLRKIRLTGGEPLVWKDLGLLISRLASIEGVEDLALTT